MRSRLIHKNSRTFVLALVSILFCVIGAQAQSSSFTYQGRLTDGGTPANVPHDFQFKLYDSDGHPQGSPNMVTKSGVPVTNGVFTVQLDFGASGFPGADRFLDISVKKPTDSLFVPLTPRQPLTSTPYAIKSLNAVNADMATDSIQLNGLAASQYVVTTDPRMTNARSPISGSDNYIQNRTTPQPASFDIGGLRSQMGSGL